MSNYDISSFQTLMTSSISLFLEKVVESRNMITTSDFDKDANPFNSYSHLDFQLFFPQDKELFAQRYSFDSLEQLIRIYLVLSPLLEALKNHGIECENANHFEFYEFAGITNSRNEETNFLELIINDTDKKYGFRFSPYNARIDISTLYRLGVDYVFSINWRSTYSKLEHHEALNFHQEFCNSMMLKDFFTMFLSIEEFEVYVSLVQDAVDKATQIMGFHTIEAYTNRHKHNIRKQLTNELENYDFNKAYYQPLKVDDPIAPSPFTDDEMHYLITNFYRNHLYYSLIGTEDFAKCFLTSEYLFQVFKDNYNFDFTPVVTGYLKSIEMLLYFLMQKTLDYSDSSLFITAKAYPDQISDADKRIRKIKGNSYHLIRFEKKYSNYFSTTIGSLSYFLFDNTNAWSHLSKASRQYVKYLLSRYGQECRNEHFHLDIVDDTNEVKNIRSNTILLFFLILSGYQFAKETCNSSLYGSSFVAFEKLFDRMSRIASRFNRFIIEFEGKTFNCLRCSSQPLFQYDEYGSTKDLCINFLIVDSFSESQDLDKQSIILSGNNRLIINKDNMPTRIWLAKKDGSKATEIIWDGTVWT